MGFDDLPEGVARPGFFRGVATVVTKLLNVVQPDYAYFGQKDALQCLLVKRLVEVGSQVHVSVCKSIRRLLFERIGLLVRVDPCKTIGGLCFASQGLMVGGW